MADDRLVRDFNDRGEQMIAARPAAGFEFFRIHDPSIGRRPEMSNADWGWPAGARVWDLGSGAGKGAWFQGVKSVITGVLGDFRFQISDFSKAMLGDGCWI